MRRVAVATVAIALCAVGAGGTTASAAPPRSVDRVLIVATPRLTWDLIADGRPANLLGLLARSAVASVSERTVGARTTLGRGYASIGAGNRATTVDITAGLSFGASEAFEGSPAAEVYERRSTSPASGAVFTLGVAESSRRNDSLLYGAHLGALGGALAAGGKRTAVVANADSSADSTLTLDRGYHREAALGMMDRFGRTPGGRVDAALLVADAAAPYGRRLDIDATAAAFRTAWDENDVVLLELSDLERADQYGDVATTAARRRHKLTALQHSDALLGRALQTVDGDKTLILVVTPAPPRTAEQLGVAAIAGPGIESGAARSATTRRAHYVTLPDIAPTVLDAFGIDPPDGMNGTAITSNGGSQPSVATARRLATDNVRARFRDKATGPVSVLFVVFQVLVYAAAALTVIGRRRARAATSVAYLSLVVLAVPVLGFVSGLFRYDRLGLAGYIAVLFAASAALAAVAWVLGRRRPLLAPGALIAVTLITLLVDVVLGGRLQLNTVFGYSPIVAGRFSGFGNLAYGLLAMTAIVTATILWAVVRNRARAAWLITAVLAVALIIDGAPPWGSDVGGVLASVPAFFLVIALLLGWRVDWRRWAIAVMATVGVVGAFALADLARPPSSRTHLGRLVANPGDFGDVIQRKALSNIHILTSSVWTLIIPVALAFLLFLAMRPPGLLQALQRDVPGLRACLVGGLVAGLLGFAVNDSGVAVPAMMLAVLLPYLTYLLTRTAPE